MTDQSGAAAHVSGGATPVAYIARQNPGDRVRPNPLVLRFHMPSPLAPQAKLWTTLSRPHHHPAC